MRRYERIPEARFAKLGEPFSVVQLPHTWNAADGHLGKEYWRGIGNYELTLPDSTPGKRQYIELRGANHVATVYCNGRELGTQKPVDHAAVFQEVALCEGENTLTAKVNGAEDTISLWGVAEHDTSYDLPDLISAMQVGNWFAEQDEQEDYGDEGFNSEVQLKELLRGVKRI